MSDHHFPCPGGCNELADECMTPGCGSPLGAFIIVPSVGSAAPAPFVDELLRGRSDMHKPTYRQLRDQGVSQRAIELLHEGRDMLELGWSPYGFAQWMPWGAVTEADVPPMERVAFVEHTFPLAADWDALTERALTDWDVLAIDVAESWAEPLPADYDPTDAEQGPLERGWAESRAHSRKAARR